MTEQKPPYEASDDFPSDFKWLMRDVRGRRLMHWLLRSRVSFARLLKSTPMRAGYMPIAIGACRRAQGHRLSPDGAD